jgi:hypothetical protein
MIPAQFYGLPFGVRVSIGKPFSNAQNYLLRGPGIPVNVQSLVSVHPQDGKLLNDWEEVIENARAFDHGDRDYEAALAKMIVQIQRMAFEKGFELGVNAKPETAKLLIFPAGNA